jgi:hypothetical protein
VPPSRVHCLRAFLPACLFVGAAIPVVADPRVAVVATARYDYAEKRQAMAIPKPESYVFMQGHCFGGSTVDRSLERMPFRRIAEFLAPELAKQNYLPTNQIRQADLLLVVHWGATMPFTGTQEMMGRNSAVTDMSGSLQKFNELATREMTSPDTGSSDANSGFVTNLQGLDLQAYYAIAGAGNGDSGMGQVTMDRLNQVTNQIAQTTTRGSNMALLGYGETMHRLEKQLWDDATELILRADLDTERYFIIVEAYDLKEKNGGSKRPVWTMHVNISSPGNNFSTAMTRMSLVAGDYAGKTTGTVVSIRPRTREGKVVLAPMVIIGEVNPASK